MLLLLALLRVVLWIATALVIDGLAVPCPMRRLEFVLQGGKRKGNCLSEASFSRLRTVTKIQGGGRHLGRAFLLLTFLWQDKEK